MTMTDVALATVLLFPRHLFHSTIRDLPGPELALVFYPELVVRGTRSGGFLS